MKLMFRALLPSSSLIRLQSGTSTSTKKGSHEKSPKPFSDIPGPKPLPILGNIRDMKKNGHRLRLYFDDCFKEYGEIFKLKMIGGYYLVVMKDPATLKEVVRTEGKYPTRDPFISGNMAWLFRNKSTQRPNLVIEEGKRWRELRSAIGKQSTPRTVQSYTSGFNNIIDRFVKYIQSARGSDETINDMNLPLKRLFMEISAKFTFDSDLYVVTNPAEEDQEFIDAVSFLINLFTRLFSELPLYKLYNNKLSRDFTKAAEVTDTVARREIDKVYSRLNSGEESETPGLLEQWLREGKLSEEDAITQAITMFTAGVDTTSNQAVFLLHAIAKLPEVQERLYAEVRSVLGESSKPTPKHLSDMPYLKGCLLESFRLCSTATSHSRLLKEDAYLLGYCIPKSNIVFYSLYSAGRDEKLFPNPMKFDPERWKRDKQYAFAIQPFGFGPRGCYGRRFAELELKLILAQMVYNFEMSSDMDEMPLIEETVVKVNADVPIKFVDRKKN